MKHADIAAFCLALPGATRDIKWGADLVFSVGGKMFCVMSASPEQHPGVSLKAGTERFLELTDQPGVLPAPYLARHHWVRLDHPAVLAPEVLRELLENSYRLVRDKLPKRLRAGLGA
jgi:predicted DNA-binding protein (MmcQ/YjbR family)